MNNFALEIWDDESKLVTFYTVRNHSAKENETDKFIDKFIDDVENKTFLQEIFNIVSEEIGDKHGARQYFFTRHERNVTALPPIKVTINEITINWYNNPLRLYCLRLSNNIVILFNGDLKTAQTAQDGKTSMTFYEANSYAHIIDEARNDGTITIKGRNIVSFDNEIDNIEL